METVIGFVRIFKEILRAGFYEISCKDRGLAELITIYALKNLKYQV